MFLFTEYEFSKCVNRYKGDRHSIKFKCRDQFLAMGFVLFTDRSGLRYTETTLICSQNLYKTCLWANSASRKSWNINAYFTALNCSIQSFIRLTEDDVHEFKIMNDVPVGANTYDMINAFPNR